jgi:hypothetical protein
MKGERDGERHFAKSLERTARMIIARAGEME